MKIRTTEAITLRSDPIALGAELDLDEITAQQLIAAGQAESAEATATVDGKKSVKTQHPDKE